MVGLIISVHFQQFENLKFLIFSRKEHAPGPPKSPSRVANRPELGGLLENPESRLDFSRNTSILILKNTSLQANEQRNIFLLNYHNICHEINKPVNLDIQVNSELQS